MTEQKTTTLRLRRIRFKDGRTVEVLRPKSGNAELLRQSYAKNAPAVAAPYFADGTISGYAIVVWGSDGKTSSVANTDGRIPGILIPDLVRNKLIADKIEEWTIDTVNGD